MSPNVIFKFVGKKYDIDSLCLDSDQDTLENGTDSLYCTDLIQLRRIVNKYKKSFE